MFNLYSILTLFLLISIAIQPTSASEVYSAEEVAACIPVGKIAINISKFQEKGLNRDFIEAALNQELSKPLSLWIKPVSSLVFSGQKKSFEVVVKQAIGYCLNTMKRHKNMPDTLKNIPDTVYVEA